MKHAIRAHLRDFLAILGIVVVALGIAGYLLEQQRLRFPFIEKEPFAIWVELSDAQAVVPGQGQTVRVAGMRVGDIGKVELKDGRARVRMDLDKEYEDIVHRDASALLRPRTGLKDMFLELDPGSKDSPLMKEGETIPIANSAPDVDPDEILRMLDADTRPYLTLLLNGVGKGLKGRGGDLREVFYRLGPLHRDLRRLNTEVVKRRRNLSRLIHNYGQTMEHLAKRDRELATLVRSSEQAFGALASEDDNISLAVSRLPSTLSNLEDALVQVDELGRTLPALEDMRPVMRQIPKTNDEVRPLARDAEPILRTRIRPFVREARPFIRTLRPAAENLAEASPDLRESFYELNRFFNMASYNPGGAEPLTGNQAQDLQRNEGFLFWLAWTTQNSSGIFSTSDASGPYRRLILAVTCSTAQGLVQEEPAREVIMNLTPILSDTRLCGS